MKNPKEDNRNIKRLLVGLVGVAVVAAVAGTSSSESANPKDRVSEKLTPTLGAAKKIVELSGYNYQRVRPFAGNTILTKSVKAGTEQFSFVVVTAGNKLDSNKVIRLDIAHSYIGQAPDSVISIYKHGDEIDGSIKFRKDGVGESFMNTESNPDLVDAIKYAPDEAIAQITRSRTV